MRVALSADIAGGTEGREEDEETSDRQQAEEEEEEGRPFKSGCVQRRLKQRCTWGPKHKVRSKITQPVVMETFTV